LYLNHVREDTSGITFYSLAEVELKPMPDGKVGKLGVAVASGTGVVIIAWDVAPGGTTDGTPDGHGYAGTLGTTNVLGKGGTAGTDGSAIAETAGAGEAAVSFPGS
jgi:hypothetical protein